MRTASAVLLGLLVMAGSVRAATPEPLIMTYVRANADYWDIDVAVEKGFFAAEGFAPDFASNAGSVQSTQLLLTQSVQVAVTQPELLVSAIARGAKDLAGIAAPMRRVDWMLVGQKGMNSVAELKGKTIGFSGLRITEFWLTQRALQEKGLSPGSYDTIQIGTTATKYAALSNGSVAATILFQPTASQAIHAGYSRLDDLGRYAGFVPGVYIVSRRWAAENNHGLRLQRALQRAHAWLYDPANKTEAIGLMMRLSKSTEAALEDVYQLYFVSEKYYTQDGTIDSSAITTAIQTLIDHHELDTKQAPALDDILLPASLGGRRS